MKIKSLSLSNFASLKFIIFFQIIKLCLFLCNERNLPFFKGDTCVNNCNLEEIKNETCFLKNEILKTQWINNINYLYYDSYHYINMVVTENQDLIIAMSSYPPTNQRVFYGLKKEGRGYFNENNKEFKIHKLKINPPYIYDSEMFLFIFHELL